jgi:DUF4097 and DUF4098 domain-containing protein YvlB
LEESTWQILEARTTSGSVRIDGNIMNSFRDGETLLESTSGSVNLEIDSHAREFNYNLSSTSGSVRVNGQNHGRNASAEGTGNHRISMRTISGSVRLDFD